MNGYEMLYAEQSETFRHWATQAHQRPVTPHAASRPRRTLRHRTSRVFARRSVTAPAAPAVPALA